jgi:uncharacterized membrane protein (DUF441 family)
MATVALPRRRRRDEWRFFTGMSAALLLATFIGFAPTYYLAGYFAAPAVGPLVHVHGVVYSVWILLVMAQTSLIAVGRPDLHRLAGTAGIALAVAIVVVGVMVAIESGRLDHGPPDRDQRSFLVYPLTNMLVFTVLAGASVALRERAAYHKRLMLLATMTLVITPLARISRMLELPFHPPAIGGMLLSDLFLAALVAFDLYQRGKLHPATLWGGGFFLLTQPLRTWVGGTDAWRSFAASLIG